jgi:DNA polymerase-3 subunit delta'
MNYFTQTVVQERVKDFFKHGIENDRLAHAYIFYSPQGSGKEAFAFELAKTLNCTSDSSRPCGECPSCKKIAAFGHPDVKYIFPLKKKTPQNEIIELIKNKAQNPYAAMPVSGHVNIPIEMIRTLKDEAKYAPYEAKVRFFIISGAEHLAGPAANSFLKLLEEPPKNLIIILITNQLDSLLDTIRSRCQPVYFPAFNTDEIMKIVKKYAEADDTINNKISVAQHDIEKVFELLYNDTSSELEMVYKYLRSLAGGNFFEVSLIIDEMVLKRDKRHSLEILNHILLWFRDSFHYSLTKDSSNFVNLDYVELICKFSDYYPALDYDRIVTLIEHAEMDMNGNGHPSMIFFNLAIKIKEELQKKNQQKKEIV